MKALIITHAPPLKSDVLNGATFRLIALQKALGELEIETETLSIGSSDSFDIKLRKSDLGILGVSDLSDRFSDSDLQRLKLSLSRYKCSDLIIMDQPFAWSRIKDLITDQKVIYISHNHETNTYFQVLRSWKFDTKTFHLWRRIAKNEIDLVRHSMGIITCSADDAIAYLKVGASQALHVPIENAKTPIQNSGKESHDNSWVFVSSEWQMNWLGLIQLVNPTSLMENGIQLKIVGRCLEAMEGFPAGNDWLKRASGGVQRIGKVENEELTNIMLESYGSIVPVLLGGGANYKLWEALQYQHRIISTSFGLRGYPKISNINIADSSSQFDSFWRNAASLKVASLQPSSNFTFGEALRKLLE